MLHYLLLPFAVCLIAAAMVFRADISEWADVGLLFAVITAMVLVAIAPADRGASSWNDVRVSRPRSSPAWLPDLGIAPIPGVKGRGVDPELRQRAAYLAGRGKTGIRRAG
jgi:hypothetical protein